MRAKQACRHLAADGHPARHLQFWLGPALEAVLPQATPVERTFAGQTPAQFNGLRDLLLETFSLSCVNTGRLQDTQSAAIYKEFMETPPTPLIERTRPDIPWDRAWPRLTVPGLEAEAVDVHFSLLHNLLGVAANQHHWGVAPSPACARCRPPAADETALHFFTTCERVSAAWHFLLFRATLTLGVGLTDESLLLLTWPPAAARADAAVTLAVTTFTAWAWGSRDLPGVLQPHDLKTRVQRAAEAGPWASIF